MDELIERVVQKKMGIKIGNEIVGVITQEMTVLLKCSEDFYDEKGLFVNSTKCVSLKVLPIKGKKAMKVVTATH